MNIFTISTHLHTYSRLPNKQLFTLILCLDFFPSNNCSEVLFIITNISVHIHLCLDSPHCTFNQNWGLFGSTEYFNANFLCAYCLRLSWGKVTESWCWCIPYLGSKNQLMVTSRLRARNLDGFVRSLHLKCMYS